MAGHPEFCPHCFALLSAGREFCSVCGGTLSEWEHTDFHHKLLRALHHPLPDVRMRAIIALGLRGDPEAATALAECALRDSSDVIEGLEIVDALRRLRPHQTRLQALERITNEHPARRVVAAAREALMASSKSGASDRAQQTDHAGIHDPDE